MTSSKKLNLQYIKKSRLKTGDVFAMLLSDESFLFGRVINAELSMLGGKVALLYIYDVRSYQPEIDQSLLTPDRLLIPPVIAFHSFWLQGYTTKIGDGPIQEKDLIRHCFRFANKYVNEFGIDIEQPQHDELCGVWGITGIGSVDDQISDAVGIKRAPLTPEDMWYMSGKGEKILLKKKDEELKKYSNYEWIIKNHPEIVQE